MALGISLDKFRAGAGAGRASERHRLQLSVVGKTESLTGFDAILRDLSRTGFLLETEVPLDPANELEIALPYAGIRQARIAWSSGKFHGCRFSEPITKAVVSAALLRAPSKKSPGLHWGGRGDLAEEGFGARLKRLRTDLSISQADFARALGVSKPTIWKWETGAARPRQDRMAEIANLLGTGLIELEHGAEASAPDFEGSPAEFSIEEPAQGRTDDLASVTRSCKSRIAECVGIPESRIDILIRF